MVRVLIRWLGRSWIGLGAAAGLVASAVTAQAAVFSLEAVAVNSFILPGGPVTKISIAPGDRVTAKIFLRDWSPNGEQLRSFQAEIDKAGFQSGNSGTVQPIEFDVPRDPGVGNDENAFIDKNDPLYVHAGLDGFNAVDVHAAPGYRWLNVLLNRDQGPVSPQDGTKFYCGTVRLEASKDAEGAFTIKFVEGLQSTGVLDPNNKTIPPVTYEPLVVEVKPGAAWLLIESSVPADGAIDAREPVGKSQAPGRGTSTIQITFTADVAGISAGDITIDDGSDKPPRIRRLTADGSTLKLTLDRGLSVGRWTTFTYRPTGSAIRMGCLPGDVNNDGVSDSRDILALVKALNGEKTPPLYRTDIDRNGVLGPEDVLRVIELIVPSFSRATVVRRLGK